MVMEVDVVLSSVGEGVESDGSVVGHSQRGGLLQRQKTSVLGRDVNRGLLDAVTGRNMNSPTSGAVHPFIAPVPVISSVGAVHWLTG